MLFVAGKNKIAYIYAGRCMDTLKDTQKGVTMAASGKACWGRGREKGRKET